MPQATVSRFERICRECRDVSNGARDLGMSALVAALAVSACVFLAGLAGLYGHGRLPVPHQSKETLDVIRLGTGMLSVLASLVLGLLIGSAKGSWDATDHATRSYAADLILLDETLRDYGDAAAAPRDTLRAYTRQVLDDRWPQDGRSGNVVEDQAAGALIERVRNEIRALKPSDVAAKSLQDQALATHASLSQQRWRIVEQQGPTVRLPVLAILVSWIMLIFGSFGLNAPRNATITTALLLCSLAIGGSVFLIFELDSPFAGVLAVSSVPMRSALEHMSTH